ncbi:FIST N-terminal domain-containing protein [uncultured Paracoccus sp.]|uniref:FIST N-terminal domain-containing protein n=1 Tax=uncultured Paracoccus sp. TaxID=189685 RepID=UPI00262592C0|nr:FIST N-terminal domain-containing protein [uncultured Paracoccus sp.]
MDAAAIRRPQVVTAKGDIDDVVAQIVAGLAGFDPSLVLFFAVEGAQVAPLSAQLSAGFGPDRLVLGCSSAGGFDLDGYADEGVIAIGFPAVSFRAKAVWLSRLRQHLALDWMVSLRDLAVQVPAPAGWSGFGLLLIDGMSGREELVAATVDAALPELLVLGGSAADGLRFGQTQLAMNGESRPESALFCMIATDFAVEEVVFDHFNSVGTRMVVTEADPDNRLLTEIDAEPAAAEYARQIGVAVENLGPRAFARNPLLERSRGRHYVRAISGVTPGGGLTLMSSVETGAVLSIGRAQGLIEGFSTRMERLGPVELVLGFDCILRRIAIEQAGEEPAVAQLCRDFRIAGFNTYGEQHGGIHVNQTFVGVAFLDRGPDDERNETRD